MTNMDKIREALEVLRTGNIMVPMGIYMDGTREMVPKVANRLERSEIIDAILAALAAIDPEAERQEPSEDAILEARRFAEEIASLYISWGVSDYYKKAAALITAHDDAIRRECADRAEDYLDSSLMTEYDRYESPFNVFNGSYQKLRAVILNTDPAREEL